MVTEEYQKAARDFGKAWMAYILGREKQEREFWNALIERKLGHGWRKKRVKPGKPITMPLEYSRHG